MKKRIVFLAFVLCLALSLYRNNFFNIFKFADNAVKDIDDRTVNIIPPTVTFETHGGTQVKDKVTTLIKTEPQTSKEKHLFLGWYLDEHYETVAVFPLSIKHDTILHAKWLKIEDSTKIEGGKFSGKSDYASAIYCDVSPNFDFDTLSQKGMSIEISVSYDIYYKKDYNIIGNIGYMGAPRYEVYLLGEDLKGVWEEDVSTPSSSQTKKLVMCTTASYFKDNNITLTFSTNNIQNYIKVENIVVNYRCGYSK